MLTQFRNFITAVAVGAIASGGAAQTAEAGHAPLPPACPACPASAAPAHENTAAAAVYAPAPASTSRSYGSATASSANGGMFFGTRGGYFYLSHTAGEGIGFEDGFTTFGLFAPFADTARGDGIWFVDGRYHLLHDSQGQGDSAFSVGLGRRAVWGNGIFGASAWYDYDDRFDGFSRAGFGLEYLACRWDARLNYYANLDDDQLLSTDKTKFLTGYSVIGRDTDNFVGGFDGIDGEIGGLILPDKCNCARGLRAYAGVYGYNGADESFAGYRGRVEYDAVDNFIFGVVYRNDSVFDSTVNGYVTWTPGRRTPQIGRSCKGSCQASYGRGYRSGKGSCRGAECRGCYRNFRLYDLVRREDRVALRQFSRNTDTVLRDADRQGNPEFRVINVNSHAAAGGDGTAENPFNTLAAAEAFSQDYDIIYLYGDSNFDENIQLRNGQRLLGEDVANTGHTPLWSVSHGAFALPRVTNATNRAVVGEIANMVAGNPGTAIHLADNVLIDSIITRGDIVGQSVSGDIQIKHTTIDCGQLALFDSMANLALKDSEIFEAAGSGRVALNLANNTGTVTVLDTNFVGDAAGLGALVVNQQGDIAFENSQFQTLNEVAGNTAALEIRTTDANVRTGVRLVNNVFSGGQSLRLNEQNGGIQLESGLYATPDDTQASFFDRINQQPQLIDDSFRLSDALRSTGNTDFGDLAGGAVQGVQTGTLNTFAGKTN